MHFKITLRNGIETKKYGKVKLKKFFFSFILKETINSEGNYQKTCVSQTMYVNLNFKS